MPELSGMVQEFLEGSIKSIGGRTPVLNHISIYENGEYTPPSGVDGYDNIVVDVPSKDEVSGTFTENGTYTPPSNKVYNEVVVNVPTPVLNHISIFENGEYSPPSGVDGYDNIVVDVPIKSEVSGTFTENGTYTPPSNKVYNEVVVNVPSWLTILDSNDGKIRVIVDSYTGLTSVYILGLYAPNGHFSLNDISDSTVKSILQNLGRDLFGKGYDSIGGNYTFNFSIAPSGNEIRLYSTNWAQYVDGTFYGFVVNMAMSYDGLNSLYLQLLEPHLPS